MTESRPLAKGRRGAFRAETRPHHMGVIVFRLIIDRRHPSPVSRAARKAQRVCDPSCWSGGPWDWGSLVFVDPEVCDTGEHASAGRPSHRVLTTMWLVVEESRRCGSRGRSQGPLLTAAYRMPLMFGIQILGVTRRKTWQVRHEMVQIANGQLGRYCSSIPEGFGDAMKRARGSG